MSNGGENGRAELTSWKEIADFLGVSVRTAQRYESEMALPVRRRGGDTSRAGAAFAEDLNTWKSRTVLTPRWWENARILRIYAISATVLLVAVSAYASRDLIRQFRSRWVSSTFTLAAFGYVVFALWFLSQGKTPGKWMAGIRVADKRAGSFPGLGRMLVREIIGKFVGGLFLGIGYFWAIFDKEGQAWHDKIAGTVVTREAAGGYAPQPMAMAAAAGSSAVQGSSRFCTGCGAAIQGASQFCAHCGSPM